MLLFWWYSSRLFECTIIFLLQTSMFSSSLQCWQIVGVCIFRIMQKMSVLLCMVVSVCVCTFTYVCGASDANFKFQISNFPRSLILHQAPIYIICLVPTAHALAEVRWRMLAYAGVCWHFLTYADICWRLQATVPTALAFFSPLATMGKHYEPRRVLALRRPSYLRYSVYLLYWYKTLLSLLV